MPSIATFQSKIDIITVLIMIFNFVTSVGIIFVNKIVYSIFDYNYATFLTVLHFITTFIGLYVLQKVNYFQTRVVKIADVIPLCLAFCGFVIFNNLSLQENTVGFYQLMKVMTTPVVASIQLVFYGIPTENKLIFALVFVIIGVMIVTASEIELEILGFVYAVLGVLSTSFYQVWIKSRQQDLQLSGPQLLYYQAPISAIMVLFITPLFDPISSTRTDVGLIDYQYTTTSIMWILLSCVLAFCVNLSIFLTIGRTSPISYNVLGHFKLCVITVGGIILFKENMNQKKFIGICTALFGITLYTFWKLQLENAWDKRNKEIQDKLPKEEVVSLLVKDDDDDDNDDNEDNDINKRRDNNLSILDNTKNNTLIMINASNILNNAVVTTDNTNINNKTVRDQ